jgi:hypothetical protein
MQWLMILIIVLLLLYVSVDPTPPRRLDDDVPSDWPLL